MKEFLSVSSDDFETMTNDALLEAWRQNHEYFTSKLSRYAPWKKKGRRFPQFGLHGTGQKSLEALQDPNNDSVWTGSCMVFNDVVGSTRSDAALACELSVRIPFNYSEGAKRNQSAGGVLVLDLKGLVNRSFHPDGSGTFPSIQDYEPTKLRFVPQGVSKPDLKPKRLDLNGRMSQLRKIIKGVVQMKELPQYTYEEEDLNRRLFSTLLTEQEVLKRSFDLLGIL